MDAVDSGGIDKHGQPIRRLECGMIIRTNFGAGPFRITEIKRGCTCRWSCAGKGPGDPPHMHLVLEWAGPLADGHHYEPYYLGGYDENTLRSLTDPKDIIEVLMDPEPERGTELVQLTLGI